MDATVDRRTGDPRARGKLLSQRAFDVHHTVGSRVKRLDGKVLVVTGASRGLGFRVCEAAIAEGARVAMLARSQAAVEDAARQLGENAIALVCDVSDPFAVASTFEKIEQRLGGLDVLVNNAAIGQLLSVESAALADVERELRTNFLGPLACIRAAIPMMRRRGGGDIVNVSSESVRRPYPLLGVYAASKSALETFSSSLRSEIRADNIRVTILRAGRMSESGFNREWSAEGLARYRELVAAGGFYAESGSPTSPGLVARSLIDALCLPRSASVDVIEIRPA